MIKYMGTLFLFGCARGINDPMPSDDITNAPAHFAHHAEYQPTEKTLVCSVSKSERIEDCTLYSLFCDDGSEQLILLCNIIPNGEIVNTPSPI